MTPPTASQLNERVSGFDRLYGLHLLSLDAAEVRAEVALQEHHLQPFGLAHGGLYAAMAESMASLGTALFAGEGLGAVGLSNSTSFLRPITEGTVHAVARRRHRGRTTWVWDVEITDDAERLCAMTRMTIAVRPLDG